MLVKLTTYELMIAAQVGVMRQVHNIKKGWINGHGLKDGQDWQLHIEGCCGEFAVAKALNLHWSGAVGNLDAADVDGLEVRLRTKAHYSGAPASLILHDRDSDGSMFILVVGLNGEYKLMGWIMGEEGKQKKFWSDPAGGRPAYFVPQKALYGIDLLVKNGDKT